jgi:hypothetical protein
MKIENKQQKPNYPIIKLLPENEWDYSAWYNEKSNNALKEISQIIDKVEKKERKQFTDVVINIIKLLTVSSGSTQFSDFDDYELIIKNGYNGYLRLIEKLHITHKDLEKLYTRKHDNDKNK